MPEAQASWHQGEQKAVGKAAVTYMQVQLHTQPWGRWPKGPKPEDQVTAGDLGQFHNLSEPSFFPICIVAVVIFTLQMVKVRNSVG